MGLPSQRSDDDSALVDEIIRSIDGADDPKKVRSLLNAWWRYAGVRAAAGAEVDADKFLAERSSLGLLELPLPAARAVIELEYAIANGPQGAAARRPRAGAGAARGAGDRGREPEPEPEAVASRSPSSPEPEVEDDAESPSRRPTRVEPELRSRNPSRRPEPDASRARSSPSPSRSPARAGAEPNEPASREPPTSASRRPNWKPEPEPHTSRSRRPPEPVYEPEPDGDVRADPGRRAARRPRPRRPDPRCPSEEPHWEALDAARPDLALRAVPPRPRRAARRRAPSARASRSTPGWSCSSRSPSAPRWRSRS